MNIIVVGGGNVGYYLVKDLKAAGHSVILMEKDRQRAARLYEDLGDLVRQGDGCESRTMQDLGVGQCDLVVAATGEDEDNLIVCQMARECFGVKRTIARVNSPANEALFTELGITTTVSSTRIIFNLIEQTEPGKGGEIQITDALMKQAQDGCVIAYKFKGQRFDCGGAEGYIEATNFCFENFYKTGKAY